MPDNTVMPVVRVAVVAGTKLVDVALPTELPLREIIPEVHRWVATDDAAPTGETLLSLGRVGGAPFSPDATLDTVGVADGDLLVLQPVPAGPAAHSIVEDVADAAVLFSDSRRKPWGIAHIRRAARITVSAVVLSATAFGVIYRADGGGGLTVAGLAGLAAAVIIAALITGTRFPSSSTELSIAALAPIAAALGFGITDGGWAPRLALAAAGVAAWSIVCLILRDRAVGFFTAAALTGLGLLLGALAAMVWTVSLTSLGCGLIVAALLVAVRSAHLSAACARLPLPVIPAPGDPTPPPPAVQSLRDLPRRVRRSDAHQTGFIAGAVILTVLGSLAVLRDSPTPWAWYLVVAAAGGSVLRARVWDSAPCKAWLLAHPHLLGLALLVDFTAGARYLAALAAVGVLVALAAAWVVVALNPGIANPQTYALPMRRAVGFFAMAIDASLIPVMAYLAGLFEWVLNR